MEQQPQEQAGFRKGYSTINHLQAVNQITEKSTEYDKNPHMILINYTKAFDSVNHRFLIEKLRRQGVLTVFINIVIDIYTDMKARVKTDETGGSKVRKPDINDSFITALEEIFRG